MSLEELEPAKPPTISNENESSQLADAFLALKEPEQPITFKEAQQLRESKEQKELQVEILTDFILAQLLDSAQHSLFPKRVVI